MRRAILIFIAILFPASFLFAQNKSLDSLRKVIAEKRNDTTSADAYLNIAALYEKTSPDSAVQLYLLAVNLIQADINKVSDQSKEINKKLQQLLAGAYASLGALYADQVKILQSLDYDYKSLKIREPLNDKVGIAEVLNNIAFIHHYYLDDYHYALETYLKALQYIREVGDKYGESTLLHNIADIYEMQGDTALALDYYMKSLKMREEIGDKLAISNALNSLAILYREKGDLEKALQYGNKSLQLRIEVGDKRGMGYAYRNLGEVYLKQGDLNKAKELGEEALQIGRNIRNPDVIEKSSFLLQKVYKQQGRWKEAYEMNQVYLQMHDSTGAKKNGIVAIRQEVNYEYEKRAETDSLKFIDTQREKDLMIQQQQALLSKEKILRNSIITISALLLLIVIIVFNTIRIRNKALHAFNANEIRRKISRDLHDEIGSGLTAISMICEQTKMKSKNRTDDTSLLGLAERIRLQSQSVYEKLREVIWATNPENNNLEVLMSYIRHYVSDFYDSDKVGTSLFYTLDLPEEVPKWMLKPDVSRNLIFLLKEALNNIAKHSNATQVDISFRFNENKNYNFKISDNGKGFDFDLSPDPSVAASAIHNGLSFMRKRSEEINGRFEIVSKTGKGTQIEISGSFT